LIIFSKHLYNSLFFNTDNNLRNPIAKDDNCGASFSQSENVDISTFKCFRLNKLYTFRMNEIID
jgi:hypothetical protein